jgi:hypothetical protein
MVSYNRPVEAKLVVQLTNGEIFDATQADFANFGLVKKLDAYMEFNRHLTKVLHEAGLLEEREDLTDSKLNPLRYLVELAVVMPELLEHPETAENDANVVKLEKMLRDMDNND